MCLCIIDISQITLMACCVKVLFSVETRTYYGKLVFDEYIYAYRFAVATGLRPGELIGLWYQCSG